jgi:methylthioribose-1-phosphate isomerase
LDVSVVVDSCMGHLIQSQDIDAVVVRRFSALPY